MALDCTTRRGRFAIVHQLSILTACAKAWDAQFVETPHDRESPVDALFTRRGRVVSVAEVRSRCDDANGGGCALSLADLRGMGSYLVTFDKLVKGRVLSAALCVPYVLIVGLKDRIVYWTVTDAKGEWLVPLATRRTKTRATVNGGSAVRMNAYLDLKTMKTLAKPG